MSIEKFPSDAPVKSKVFKRIVRETEIVGRETRQLFKRSVEVAGFKIDAGALDLQVDPEVGNKIVAHLHIILSVKGTEQGIPSVSTVFGVVAQVETCLHLQGTAEEAEVGEEAVFAREKGNTYNGIVTAVLQHLL